MEEAKKGSGWLYSLLWHYTNMVKMCASMASFYILHQTYPMFQSHETATLVLSAGLSAVDDGDQLLQVPRINDKGSHSNISPYTHYLLRPDRDNIFDKISWYRYVREYEMVKMPKQKGK